MNETRYPLCWPANWKRSTTRVDAQFGKVNSVRGTDGVSSYATKSRISISCAIDRLAMELSRMGIKEENVIISTNMPLNLNGTPRADRGEPSDPGVAIYWKRKGKSECMATDRYRRVADNIAAISATLEAFRAVERHGGASILDRAFTGFAQLPQSIVTQRPWREVLGFSPEVHVDADMLQSAYRARASRCHPDTGGNHDAMTELNAAREAALRELHG